MKATNGNSLKIGIDIGGTHTSIGIVDSDGNILNCHKLNTPDFDTVESFTLALHEASIRCANSSGASYEQIAGVGIGAPCINHQTGVIEGAVDLPWPSPIPFKEKVSEKFGLPVSCINDANSAAIGEMKFGCCKGSDNFIMITLGTGVGSAIVADGRLIHGIRGLAGELGHTIVRRDSDRICSCGRKGCLETYCSARGIVKTAIDMIGKHPCPILSSVPQEELTSKIISEAARNGDEAAIATFRFTGTVLGEGLADFAAFSSPEKIVIFGGIAKAWDLFYPSMMDSFNHNLLWIYRDQITIERSMLPEASAAILGAAAAVEL